MARRIASSGARILITFLVMARRTIFGDTSSLEVVMASETDATEVLAGNDGTSEVAVVVVDEQGFGLALARSSPDVTFAVALVVDEEGFDLHWQDRRQKSISR